MINNDNTPIKHTVNFDDCKMAFFPKHLSLVFPEEEIVCERYSCQIFIKAYVVGAN